MYPARFDYHSPGTLEQAIALLAEIEDAKVLAGGHSLIPIMKQRLAAPAALIDLRNIAALRGIRGDGGALVISAMTTHAEVAGSALVHATLPVVADLAIGIGDPQVRNRGTIGGSLVHADPGADYPALVLALEARMTCVGPEGARVVEASDWFEDMMTASIAPDEILTEIRFDSPAPSTRAAYSKYPHPASGLSQVGVAVAVDFAAGGAIAQARIGVTGLGDVPCRALEAEEFLAGRELSAPVIARAGELIRNAHPVTGDNFSSAAHLQDLLLDRLTDACRRIGEAP